MSTRGQAKPSRRVDSDRYRLVARPRTLWCVSACVSACVLVRSRSLTLDQMLSVTTMTVVAAIASLLVACLCIQKACRKAALAQARALRDSDERQVAFRSGELALLLKN